MMVRIWRGMDGVQEGIVVIVVGGFGLGVQGLEKFSGVRISLH